MTIMCPSCLEWSEHEAVLLDGQRLQCPHCQLKFVFSTTEQNDLVAITERAEENARLELGKARLKEIGKKATAKARKAAKEEFYKNSCFPEMLKMALVFVAAGLIISCVMWYKFAKALEFPGWGWYVVLGLCMLIPASWTFILTDKNEKDYKDKKHKPRAIAALSSCIIVIAAIYIQILSMFAILPLGKTLLEHEDAHTKMRKDKEQSMEMHNGTSSEKFLGYEYSPPPPLVTCPLYNKEEWIGEPCRKYEEENGKYDTCKKTLNWMCWIGTLFALVGYGRAFFLRRKELLS